MEYFLDPRSKPFYWTLTLYAKLWWPILCHRWLIVPKCRIFCKLLILAVKTIGSFMGEVIGKIARIETFSEIFKHHILLIGLWVIKKPKDVIFVAKSTFPCQPMRCIFELTIKIANVPFVAKLSHAHGYFKATYELIRVSYSGLFSASHIVWKLAKMSHLDFPNFGIFTKFLPKKHSLTANFRFSKVDILGIFTKFCP